MIKKDNMSSIMLVILSAILSVFAANCNGSAAAVTTKFCGQNTVDGHITANMTVGGAGQTCTFTGINTVDAGVTLTIAAGTTMVADAAASPTTSLIVQPGAIIMAQGTATNPIVFTSSKATGSRAPGDWGGLVLRGKATVNIAGGTYTSELPDVGTSGGTNDADNSGVLNYVVVQFGGKQMDSTHEYNGITFESVGNGTSVDYIQLVDNADDGIEFFGGAVNVSHVVSTNNHDDMLDWTYGYHGHVQFALLGLYGGASDATMNDSNFIEADGSDKNETATPNSIPVISNVTALSDNNDRYKFMFRLRRGTGAKIYNVYVANSCVIPGVESDSSNKGVQGNTWAGGTVAGVTLPANSLLVDSALFENVAKSTGTQLGVACAGAPLVVAQGTATGNVFSVTYKDSATPTAGTVVHAAGEGLMEFTGNKNIAVATVATAGINTQDPTATGSAFSPVPTTSITANAQAVPAGFAAATYIGAFAGGTNWTAGWTQYPAN